MKETPEPTHKEHIQRAVKKQDYQKQLDWVNSPEQDRRAMVNENGLYWLARNVTNPGGSKRIKILPGWFRPSSTTTSSVARSTWTTLMEKSHAPSQSRCWPSPSWLCGARECSMINTIVKPLSAQMICPRRTGRLVGLVHITSLLSPVSGAVGSRSVFWIGFSVSGIYGLSAATVELIFASWCQ